MRALRGIHCSLRPGGLLLDICPLPAPARVEVERRDGVVPAGQMGREELIGRIHASQAALDSLVRRGLFVRETATSFEFVNHFDTVDDWLAYREERGTTTPLDEALLVRARAAHPRRGRSAPAGAGTGCPPAARAAARGVTGCTTLPGRPRVEARLGRRMRRPSLLSRYIMTTVSRPLAPATPADC